MKQANKDLLEYIPECFFCLGILTILSFFSCRDRQIYELNDKEMLGKIIFFDEDLSNPKGQSCATCHAPKDGFADKDKRIVSEGAVKGLFSNRNSMTTQYAAYIPSLSFNEKENTYSGGLFWDGRVNSLEEQAQKPFLNPLEMANKDIRMVVQKLKKAWYYPLFVRVYGDIEDPDSMFKAMADAIATYERSKEINPFDSKYDAYLEGKYRLTEGEARGMELFQGKALCSECHVMEPDPKAKRVLFTDHTYDNLGIPVNSANPFYTIPAEYNPKGRDSIDIGLGAIVGLKSEYGKFRVPTLRNLELTAPYGHNGYFKTIEDIVHFYNVRDVGDEYPPAEYPETVNKDELGNLKLTAGEEADIVAFLRILTDGYD